MLILLISFQIINLSALAKCAVILGHKILSDVLCVDREMLLSTSAR